MQQLKADLIFVVRYLKDIIKRVEANESLTTGVSDGSWVVQGDIIAEIDVRISDSGLARPQNHLKLIQGGKGKDL